MDQHVQLASDQLRHDLRLSRFPTDDALQAFHSLMRDRLLLEEFTHDTMRELLSLPMTATSAVHYTAKHPERYSLHEVARFADLSFYLSGLVESVVYGLTVFGPTSPLCDRIAPPVEQA